MNSILRLFALLVCVALGIGAAMGLAMTSSPPNADQSRKQSCAHTSLSAPKEISPRFSPETTRAVAPTIVSPVPAFTQNNADKSKSFIDRLENVLETLSTENNQREKQLTETLHSLAQSRLAAPSAPEKSTNPLEDPSEVSTIATPAHESAATPQKAQAIRAEIKREGEGDHNLSIHIQDSDIREVLDMLSEQGGLNILASNRVQGRVTASLNKVDIDTALAAILKSTGYIARREKNFLYVGSAEDFQSMEQSLDKITTRIYRPNYIKASELQTLITPLLTKSVGFVSVTTPAQAGIAGDTSSAGADGFAGGEAVLVKDYEAVLAQVDQVFEELDKRPMQVAIEAMILSVRLDDTNSFGIDFLLLRDKAHVRMASGSPLQDLGEISFKDGGLKFGFLDSSLGAFLEALETIGDTNVIATPRLMCLNKQKAEVLIGSQLGYVNTTLTETSSAQNVQFLEVGTQLRLRPFISGDGLIRMEVHPELSTGTVRVEGGFTLPDKDLTQVTTNIMVRDGCTVVIGGLMQEDLTTETTQIPLLGSMPGIGFLFRQKKETTGRREIVVLITPHIVYEPSSCAEGDQAACEFHRRQAAYTDHMSPIGTRYIGRKYFRIAQDRWAQNDQVGALKSANLAIHFDPLNRAAIDLRADIMAGNHTGDHSGGNGEIDPGSSADLTIGDNGDHPTQGTIHPLDAGVTGRARTIVKPRAGE